MGKINDVIGLGCPTPLAEYLVAGTVGASVTAAGSTITDATDLTATFNNVATVTVGQGVQLFDDDIGRSIVVRNSGNATLNVYPPTASGTINGGSAGAAFALNAATSATFTKLSSTAWIAELGQTQGFENGITAAGTIITDATDLSRAVNNVTTAAASTGVQLYAAPVGVPVYIRNAGANPINVFPPDGSSTINGGSAGAAVILANTELGIFIRLTSTVWIGGVAVVF